MQAAWQQLVGTTLEGRFRLTHFIDAGAYGGVYEADEIVGDVVMRSIALKLLRPPERNRDGEPPTPEQRDALLDLQLGELQLSSRLEHPHLIRSYSVGLTELAPPAPHGLGGELLYIVMELGAATLADLLRERTLTPAEALDLLRQLVAVLRYLHDEAHLPQGRRLAHRDLKPANILQVANLRGGFRWKLSDLGTLRACAATDGSAAERIGTLEYAPPEAFAGAAGPAGDIWSLGIVLCEALSGELPFGAGQPDPAELQRAILSDAPRLPRPCPPPFDKLLEGCLLKDPARRLSCAEIEALLAAEPAAATQRNPAQPAAMPRPTTTDAAAPSFPPAAAPLHDTQAEAQLRVAVQRALEDHMLSPYERSELNELRKRLDIRLERAASIFREEHARAEHPSSDPVPRQSAPSAPPLAPAAAPPLPAPDQRSFSSPSLAQPGAPAAVSPVASAPRQGTAEFVVDADPVRNAPFRRISDAIAAAPSGSRILIRTGLYRESLILDKPLELVGYDAQARVQIVSPTRHALVVNCDGVVLRRLQLQAGQQGQGSTSDLAVSALVVSRGRMEAEDCGFVCHSENCVAVFGATALALFKRCEIAGGRSVGLSVTHDARVVGEQCHFHGCGLAGASCANGGNLRLTRCQLSRCTGYGALVYVEGMAALRECTIEGNGADGVALKNGGRAELERCRINANRGAAVLVQTGCAASVKGCDLSGNTGRAFNLQRGASVIREANVE